MWRIRVGEYRVMYSISNERELVIIEEVARRDSQTYERLP
jgi:mRNA-degrading endonuclease RelE of RelBE toxin-antitoxin system